MIYFVKGLREVEQDGVCLSLLVKAVGEVAHSCDELCFATAPLPESVLVFIQIGVPFQMIHYHAVDDVFKELRGN